MNEKTENFDQIQLTELINSPEFKAGISDFEAYKKPFEDLDPAEYFSMIDFCPFSTKIESVKDFRDSTENKILKRYLSGIITARLL